MSETASALQTVNVEIVAPFARYLQNTIHGPLLQPRNGSRPKGPRLPMGQRTRFVRMHSAVVHFFGARCAASHLVYRPAGDRAVGGRGVLPGNGPVHGAVVPGVRAVGRIRAAARVDLATDAALAAIGGAAYDGADSARRAAAVGGARVESILRIS